MPGMFGPHIDEFVICEYWGFVVSKQAEAPAHVPIPPLHIAPLVTAVPEQLTVFIFLSHVCVLFTFPLEQSNKHGSVQILQFPVPLVPSRLIHAFVNALQ